MAERRTTGREGKQQRGSSRSGSSQQRGASGRGSERSSDSSDLKAREYRDEHDKGMIDDLRSGGAQIGGKRH